MIRRYCDKCKHEVNIREEKKEREKQFDYKAYFTIIYDEQGQEEYKYLGDLCRKCFENVKQLFL